MFILGLLEIVRKFKDDKNAIFAHSPLSIEIIREFKDKWTGIYYLEIIREFKDKWNWDSLSGNSCLTPEIIREFKDKLNWKQQSSSFPLTPDIVREFRDTIPTSNYGGFLDINVDTVPIDFIPLMFVPLQVHTYLRNRINEMCKRYQIDVTTQYFNLHLIPELATLTSKYMN